ncbi:hypothetical protein S7711_09884 [Stachybotrys chartarum IBT 7711]|uniref:Glycoside hydrolase family 88 protein n=1 Tax=Stachybotrys chartarum (strain CBS 109288 / IBT 7711) TaxID=1280523 RepID=A0A084AZI7_STACB|nr:hypothetical protein S7711_09884 [Stachybotrys chartarum IBT 7711]
MSLLTESSIDHAGLLDESVGHQHMTENGLRQGVADATFDAFTAEATSKILSSQYVDGIWKIAKKVIDRTDCPDLFPHYTLPGLPYYVYLDSSFWTSGFFPGSVWTLYERSLITPLTVPSDQLLQAARKWQAEMAKEQFCTDNHDLGFMIMPSFGRDFDLTGSRAALDVVVNAAQSLATRFDPNTQVIRSWAGARTKEYDLNNADVDFVVVIDSMMNLELLYYAAKHTGNARLADIATAHATTTLRNHVRDDCSTYHLVNYDARNGSVRNRLTNQGYANESTWARGQAWALYGYTSVYHFTKNPIFLDAACRIADYFLSRVDQEGPHADVVWWDFDAPRPGVWDVSAACCASSGLIFLHQEIVSSTSNDIKTSSDEKSCASTYLHRARRILDNVARYATSTGDALFERSTSNDNANALFRLAEHGCVYADYYFLEAGNRLLQLGSAAR